MKEDIHNELVSISTIIAEIPYSNPFTAPEAYFTKLPNQVITLCKSEHTDLLDTLQTSSSGPFEVPDNYFITLPAAIISKTKKHPSKIISIKYFYKSLVAALFLGCIGWGLYSLIKSPKAQEKKEDDITLVIQSAKEILSKDNFNVEFNALNEKDASEYLLANGDDINAALVASLCEDNSLPSEEEILYEPSVFDSCVHQVNIQNKHEL